MFVLLREGGDMEPIHHHAVVAVWVPDEEATYQPFSGYGGYDGYYLRAAPWRGNSTIPHHFAVESREDGERNGRIFYGPHPDEIAARRADRPRARPVFRMDARHAAVVDQPAAAVVIRPPSLIALPGLGYARTRPSEAPRKRASELVGAPS
jgi:hypothetical protein